MQPDSNATGLLSFPDKQASSHPPEPAKSIMPEPARGLVMLKAESHPLLDHTQCTITGYTQAEMRTV